MNNYSSHIIGILILVIILLCFYHNYTVNSFYNKYLFGTWESDITFNKSSDISSMKLFIGPLISNIHNCYLHIDSSDSKNITSQVVKMKMSKYNFINNFIHLGKINSIKYNVELEYEEPSDTPIIPINIILELDPYSGLIRLYDDENNLYGALYKDNSISHLLYLEYEHENNTVENSNDNNSNIVENSTVTVKENNDEL